MAFEKPPENVPEEKWEKEKTIDRKTTPQEKAHIKQYAEEHEKNKKRHEALEKIGAMNIGVGDTIISKDGTERMVRYFNLLHRYLRVLTEKPNQPPKEQVISFEELALEQDQNLIDRIEHVEQSEEK